MSRHWTRPWGFPGKAIEIPTCKDAGGWDHGEINREQIWRVNVTKETKGLHRDWSSGLRGRDIDIDVTQPRRCQWNWRAVGDDEPDGKGRGENILCERTACAEKSSWRVWTPEERLVWLGQAEVNRTSSCYTCLLSLQSSDCLCASAGPHRLSRLHQEMKGNLPLDSRTYSFLRLMPLRLHLCSASSLFPPLP